MSRRKRLSKERNVKRDENLKYKRASLRYLRISPQKVRAVTNTIQGRMVEDALVVLKFTRRRAAEPVARMLHSAVANAACSDAIDVDTLKVKEIRVDQGPTLKRMRPRAMGRATTIQKKTSHVTVLLEETK